MCPYRTIPKPTFSLDDVGYRNMSQLARDSGFPLRTIQRWNRYGIPLGSADKLANRLGLHPGNIWLEWWDVDWVGLNQSDRVW